MKKFVVIILVIALAFVIVGCEKEKEPIIDGKAPIGEPAPVLPGTDGDNNMGEVLKDYYLVGNIIEFKDNAVVVISGDMLQDIGIVNETLKEYYIGETVGIKKTDDDKFTIEHFINEDFNVRHTTMGWIIESVTGTIKEVKGSIITIATTDGDIEFETGTGDLSLEIGTEITVEYFNNDTNIKVFINYYDESFILNLNVKEITRSDNGIMIVKTADDNDQLYDVYVLQGTVLNFNHKDLQVGDAIKVYPSVIREIYPNEVDAKKIIK